MKILFNAKPRGLAEDLENQSISVISIKNRAFMYKNHKNKVISFIALRAELLAVQKNANNEMLP